MVFNIPYMYDMRGSYRPPEGDGGGSMLDMGVRLGPVDKGGMPVPGRVMSHSACPPVMRGRGPSEWQAQRWQLPEKGSFTHTAFCRNNID